MSTTREIARRYLVEEYLTQEPDFMSMVEWFEDQPELRYTPDYSDLFDEVLALLDIVAMRLEDEDL